MVPELAEGEITAGYIKKGSNHNGERILAMLPGISLGTGPIKYSLQFRNKN